MSTRPFRAILPCFLAWLLPGAGHLYLGKRGRAAIFFLIVLSMFVLGLISDGRSYLVDQDQPLTYLATFANVATGPLEMISRQATYDRLVYRLPGAENDPESARLLESMRRKVRSVTNEYGTTYLLTAGLMNLLLILDAFDIAIGRKV